jgi:uncharacterized membrane protein
MAIPVNKSNKRASPKKGAMEFTLLVIVKCIASHMPSKSLQNIHHELSNKMKISVQQEGEVQLYKTQNENEREFSPVKMKKKKKLKMVASDGILLFSLHNSNV